MTACRSSVYCRGHIQIISEKLVPFCTRHIQMHFCVASEKLWFCGFYDYLTPVLSYGIAPARKHPISQRMREYAAYWRIPNKLWQVNLIESEKQGNYLALQLVLHHRQQTIACGIAFGCRRKPDQLQRKRANNTLLSNVPNITFISVLNISDSLYSGDK